jgi:ubiquitin-protein ligase
MSSKKKILVRQRVSSSGQSTLEPTPTPKPSPEILNIVPEMEIDDYVVTNYKASNAVTEFLIKSAYIAMESSRADNIFEPIPDKWMLDETTTHKEQLLSTTNISNKLEKFHINRNVDIVLEAIKTSYNDKEIIEKLGTNTYELICFIIKSNKMMIQPYNIVDIKDNKIMQFKIIHTQLVEDKFAGKKSIYLYHGSRTENWYSIMRNDIKIGSRNIKYYTNGDAYGIGIYLSNDISMSLGYCRSKYIVNYSTHEAKKEPRTFNILAIFQVLENPKWYKTPHIFVVDDEDALLLRYLLIIPYSAEHEGQIPELGEFFTDINKTLNTGGIQKSDTARKELESKNVITIHNKRLMKEYKTIANKNPVELGFRIALADEDKLDKWIIYITNPENPKLQSQMAKLGIAAIELEITFKENYPIAPPFIRVVYPHFKFHSGHVTVGGSFCMEMLTNQGWSATFSIENVITQIKSALVDGNGEIDEVKYKQRYSMDEAQDAFKRVLATHKWV